MICMSCGSRMYTADTTNEKNYICYRRRYCKKCGNKIFTKEVLCDERKAKAAFTAKSFKIK